MNMWTMITPWVSQAFRDILRTVVGPWLVANGVANGSNEQAVIGALITLGGVLWGWWTTKGANQVVGLLKKLTAAQTHTDAVEKAQAMPPASATVVATAIATKVSAVLLAVMLAGLLAWPGDARAQIKLKPLTGNLGNDLGLTSSSKTSTALDNIATVLAKPFTDIANFIGEDADQAIALSTVLPALQDGHGQQCWVAMKSFGDIIKAHPIPITFHVINDYETLRLLGMATNNLCSNVHCTQVFADATAMAQAASPIPLAIPSLHDLCTKVPQIAVVAPVTLVPAAGAPVVTPTAPCK